MAAAPAVGMAVGMAATAARSSSRGRVNDGAGFSQFAFSCVAAGGIGCKHALYVRLDGQRGQPSGRAWLRLLLSLKGIRYGQFGSEAKA
jgi:hypothetical protein